MAGMVFDAMYGAKKLTDALPGAVSDYSTSPFRASNSVQSQEEIPTYDVMILAAYTSLLAPDMASKTMPDMASINQSCDNPKPCLASFFDAMSGVKILVRPIRTNGSWVGISSTDCTNEKRHCLALK